MQERGLRVDQRRTATSRCGRQVTGDLATIGHGRRRVPRREGARPDRAGADAARRCSGPTPSSSARRTASRGGTSRATAASSNGLRLERVDPGGVIAARDRAAPRGRLARLLRHRHRRARRDPPHRGQPHQLRRARRHASPSGPSAIAEALIAAGLRCPVTTRFRHEIWVKLLGNVAFNPISALTGGTLEELVAPPRDVAARARADDRDRGGRRPGSASSCRSRSTSGWPAPRRSARTRRRCCRTSRPAGRWSSKRWSARWSSWASGSACRCRRRGRSMRAPRCSTTQRAATQRRAAPNGAVRSRA